ncbi:hypothetical protein P7S38_002425 [Klebsiella variicola]|nr:hypothetical protein [Klebsiella variicola]
MANITEDTFEPGEIHTLISALMYFKDRMSKKSALGEDEIGECLRLGYLHQCDRLLLAIEKVLNK